MKKWIIAILTVVLVIILGVAIGFFIGNQEVEESPESLDDKVLAQQNQHELEVVNELSIATSGQDEKTTPSTKWLLKTTYNDCGHTIEEKQDIPTMYVNLTKEELKEKLEKEWDIEEFSKDKVVLSRYQHGICKEHYVLREKDGYIAIYTLNQYDQEEFLEMTEISVQYLPELDVENLKKGIQVTGKKELNETIEDYE